MVASGLVSCAAAEIERSTDTAPASRAQVMIIEPADASDSEDVAAGSGASASGGLNRRAIAALCSHARYATAHDAGLQDPVTNTPISEGEWVVQLPCRHVCLEASCRRVFKMQRSCPVCTADLSLRLGL